MATPLASSTAPHWARGAPPAQPRSPATATCARWLAAGAFARRSPWLPPDCPRPAGIAVRSFANDDARDVQVDADFVEAVNEVCNKTLKAIIDLDEEAAQSVYDELEDMRKLLLSEEDAEASTFLRVLQGLLQHSIIGDAATLQGLYLDAFNRLANSIQGSEWKIAEEGKSAEVNDGIPKFSTWDDVLKGKRSQQDSPQDVEYYEALGLQPSSSQKDIKSAYRKLALRWHPDVSKEADAESIFKKISQAYDVLSDETARALYDKYGAEGMKSHMGASAGTGNSKRDWDEFKPFKRENHRTRARAAAREASSGEKEVVRRTAEAGDVVEYPLSDLVKDDLQDGREKGVGLLVGRNIDRGDADKLPEDVLDMCEIEPLRQEEHNSNRWIPDELGCSAFCRLGDLSVVPVSEYDSRFDVWTIVAELSPGCGGPEIVEEVML
ncbi:unnamed protein product [Ostreobium quekettii]|uniref:J domain-containing protein n=1 Tax=Ostreobium quekettii TaxID=121088 RepID=A0A8S1IVL8_9CHLO|nr:unnamed protein product [Ostreobium quekettii]